MDLLEDIFNAYYEARKSKRNTTNQLHFEMNLEENLIGLYRDIKERRYQVGKSICFMVTKPVKREVFAATFRDRIVHHLLFMYLNPLFERVLIYDCYSCRKGKGTLVGIERLEKHIRSCTNNYTRPSYVLKLDLKGYFMSINREKLYRRILKIMKKYAALPMPDGILWEDTEQHAIVSYLLPLVIFNDPTENCLRKGSPREWDGLPPSKSLFHSPRGCGLPIGNLTSQLFSNIYLCSFDQYVKRQLKIKHYGRYVDDFFLVHQSKDVLVKAIPKIRDFLRDELDITLHPNKIVLQPYQHGVVFLGAVIKPFRRYVHTRFKTNFIKEINRWEKHLASFNETPPVELLRDARNSINSYLGIMQHFKSLHIRQKHLSRLSAIYKYGWFETRYEKFTLRKEYAGTISV